jgi:hypothetical protein
LNNDEGSIPFKPLPFLAGDEAMHQQKGFPQVIEHPLALFQLLRHVFSCCQGQMQTVQQLLRI